MPRYSFRKYKCRGCICVLKNLRKKILKQLIFYILKTPLKLLKRTKPLGTIAHILRIKVLLIKTLLYLNVFVFLQLLFGSGGQALSGACAVNCFPQFVTFLAVMCCLKFVGATGRASNFLVSVRSVPEKDKTAAMGFGMMMMSMMAFIPSPIFFGWVLDRLCLVWGKTCSNKGNCWLYDPESLR